MNTDLVFERATREALNVKRNGKIEYVTKKFRAYSEQMYDFKLDHIITLNLLHDIIIKNIFEKLNCGIIPKTINNPIILEKYDFLNDEIITSGESIQNTINTIGFNFYYSYNELLSHYPYLTQIHFSAKRFTDALRDINCLYFNLCPNIRLLELEVLYNAQNNIKNKRVLLRNRALACTNPDKAKKLFSVDILETFHSKKGMINSSMYIKFDTFFSLIALHGLKTLNIDKIPFELYKIKDIKADAKLLYILMLARKEKKEIDLGRMEIVEKLNVVDDHIANQDRRIKKMLDSLSYNGFIKGYETNRGTLLNKHYLITKIDHYSKKQISNSAWESDKSVDCII